MSAPARSLLCCCSASRSSFMSRPAGLDIAGRARAARRVPAIDAAVALVNQGVTRRFGVAPDAGTRASRRSARAFAHAGGRANAVDPARSRRRTDRANGNPSSRQHRRGDPVRFALGLARCGKRDGRGRRRAAADGSRSRCPSRTAGTRRRPAGTGFCCSIAGGYGTKASACGSAGSASAASCTS